ncbi:MAG: sulfate adenylyltransferase [Thermoplasmata archaeon]
MVNSPYGGSLKISFDDRRKDRYLEEFKNTRGVIPFVDFFYDSLKISDGSYSPLEGFMSEEEMNSVLERMELPNGLPWTIPIFLAVQDDEAKGIRPGEEVPLRDLNGKPYGFMRVETKFFLDKKRIAESVYGTLDRNHPNVDDLFSNYGSQAISGKVFVFDNPPLPGGSHEMHPADARNEFERRGWRNVVAYQARNPPHVAHEYLQKVSLEMPGIDGLLIHLVVGRLKKGDYSAEAILDSYEALVNNYHRAERVAMASLSITMRYAGPKAAVFLAIVRRNFGATHYIVGRDQAGVGNYYDPYAAHRIFEKLDLGIVPLLFKETFYCRKCESVTSENVCPHSPEQRMVISQTRIREMLRRGEEIPREIMRPEIAKILSREGQLSN